MLQLQKRSTAGRMDSTSLRALKVVLERKYNCLARHAGAVRVLEQWEGQMLWDGYVEVFELMGHANACQCYTWITTTSSGQPEFVTSLSPPAKSPQDAVRTYLTKEHLARH